MLFAIVAITPIYSVSSLMLESVNQTNTAENILLVNDIITIIASVILIVFINNVGLISPILFILGAAVSIIFSSLTLGTISSLVINMAIFALYMLGVINLLRSGAGYAKIWLLALYTKCIFVTLPPLINYFLSTGVYDPGKFNFEHLWAVTNWINSYLVTPVIAVSIILTFYLSNIYRNHAAPIRLTLHWSILKDLLAISITLAAFTACIYQILTIIPSLFRWMGE